MAYRSHCDQLSFADLKISGAHEAISNQISVIFRLKAMGINVGFAKNDLDNLNRELRRWQEFRALLLIKQGMIGSGALEEAIAGA